MPKAAARPAGYDPKKYPPFAVTVDVIVLTIDDGKLKVLLVERGEEPYKGRWAIPGGFVREHESLQDAAERELFEETAIDVASHLEQFHAYGEPDRDPRLRVVTVAYLAVVPTLDTPQAGTDARRAALVSVDQVLGQRPSRRLAFDHAMVLRDAIEEARTMLETTSIATAFVHEPFSLSDLRGVYEIVWGQPLDIGNFRRKVLSTPGFVVPTGRRGKPGPEGGKAPDLYKVGRKVRLDPPIRRPTGDGLI
jgi:8-oxo-dGTP diphosphatase